MIKNGLNNNQLKVIALVTMTLDHIGVLLLPQVTILRLVGRLSFPIFAYMIAEGCAHTRSMPRYLGTMASLAAVCQAAYFFAMGSLYQSVLVTFTLSISLTWLVKWALSHRSVGARLLAAAGILAALFVTELAPLLLTSTDFAVDYGFLGVILPVAVFLGRTKQQKLRLALVVLVLMAVDAWPGQWAALLTLPLLALYNGRRGKADLKWLFYVYYPAHLLVLEGVSLLLSR